MRIFEKHLIVFLAPLIFQAAALAQSDKLTAGKDTLVYVGTHTGEKSKGIYLFRLQTTNLEVSQNITLVPLGLVIETPNPAFFEIDLKRRLLFAVNEMDNGSVSAFAIDPTGKLTLLSQSSSKGAMPCHLALDKQGKFLAVTNCASGNVAILPIAADGKLGEVVDIIQHSGQSIRPDHQKAPRPHGVAFDPAGQFMFVADVGLDKVMAYKFDGQSGKLSPANPAFVAVKAGAGPRHIAFRPDGRFAYIVNELNSTVTVFSYDAATGALKEEQSVSSLPEYFDGSNTALEIGMHPTGKWLYVSNNGQNGVVLFDIDSAKGTLTYVEEQGTGGTNPVHFGIQPSAQHLAIVNHDTNQVLASRIDSGNGRLKPSGVFATLASPTCVKFLPPSDAAR